MNNQVDTKRGLQQLRFVNSAFFDNEVFNLQNSVLLLGSSGVGKTTILTAICYFYIQSKLKNKISPEKRDKDFF